MHRIVVERKLGMVAGAELNAALAEPVPGWVEGAREKEDGTS